jgi:hypothetical protein
MIEVDEGQEDGQGRLSGSRGGWTRSGSERELVGAFGGGQRWGEAGAGERREEDREWTGSYKVDGPPSAYTLTLTAADRRRNARLVYMYIDIYTGVLTRSLAYCKLG